MSNDENTLKVGSNPTAPTISTRENEECGDDRTDSAQNAADSASGGVNLPRTVRHHKTECKIYDKKPAHSF
jgi:hypothetical protein